MCAAIVGIYQISDMTNALGNVGGIGWNTINGFVNKKYIFCKYVFIDARQFGNLWYTKIVGFLPVNCGVTNKSVT